MLVYSWASAADGGPPLNQHCLNVSCFLGSYYSYKSSYTLTLNRKISVCDYNREDHLKSAKNVTSHTVIRVSTKTIYLSKQGKLNQC